METTRIDSLFQRAQALFSGAKACYNRGRVKQTGEEHPMQIMDQFGAAPGAESVRMPDGTERTLAAEHAAAKYCQIVYKNQLIDNCNTGHLLGSQLSYHNVIQKTDQIRYGIL